MDDLYVVDRTSLAKIYLPNGMEYDVVATRHNRNWPGTDSALTFAVEKWGWFNKTYGVIATWGFFREEDCYDFLTSNGERRYQAWDRLGCETIESRYGLAIPDAYVSRYSYVI